MHSRSNLRIIKSVRKKEIPKAETNWTLSSFSLSISFSLFPSFIWHPLCVFTSINVLYIPIMRYIILYCKKKKVIHIYLLHTQECREFGHLLALTRVQTIWNSELMIFDKAPVYPVDCLWEILRQILYCVLYFKA